MQRKPALCSALASLLGLAAEDRVDSVKNNLDVVAESLSETGPAWTRFLKSNEEWELL
jgi:hypothetical protein